MKPMTIDVKSLVRDDDLSKEALQRFIDKFAVHAVMPLEKLIATLCNTDDLTDAEVREELAAEVVDLDAAKARFMPKLDDLMRARAVRLALAALKANPPHECSPLPWANDDEGALYCRSGYQLGRAKGHARHIRAAVNAAPVLAAEVERLQGLLAAARVAVDKWVPIHANDCAGWCIDEHAASMALEGCDCGIADEDIACRAARRAAGLEG